MCFIHYSFRFSLLRFRFLSAHVDPLKELSQSPSLRQLGSYRDSIPLLLQQVDTKVEPPPVDSEANTGAGELPPGWTRGL